MLEELKVKAKELGIKSVHLYKSEEKLQAKIDEVLFKGRKLPAVEINPEEFVIGSGGVEVIMANVKEVVEAEKPKIRTWEVISGKFYLGKKRYVAGETFESNDDYSKVFPIKEV